MKKLAKDPNTPVDYQIKLEEEALRIEQDPAFAMQVKNHAAKIQLAQDRQVLPTTIFSSSADKQIAFGATFPHLRFAITAPGEDVPKMVKPDGSPVGDAEFKVIKAAWDQFEFKPGQAIPKVTASPFGYTPPVGPATAAPAAPAPVRPGIGLLSSPATSDFWTEGKSEAARLARLQDATDEELKAIASGVNPDEPGEMNFPPFKDGETYSAKLAAKIAGQFRMPAGGAKAKGRSGDVTPEEFIKAAAADELARRGGQGSSTLTPERQAKADALFQ